jgi:hypothetical protein
VRLADESPRRLTPAQVHHRRHRHGRRRAGLHRHGARQGDGELLVEQSLPIAHITGEEDAEGTGDAVILRGDEIIVIDLKFGRGVEVSAIDNPQLMLYGLGALEKFGLLGDFKRVRMVISQPRITAAPSEFVMDVPALVEWGLKARRARRAHAQCEIYNGSERRPSPERTPRPTPKPAASARPRARAPRWPQASSRRWAPSSPT